MYKYKNKKLIIINGMTRSGSNILWNIIASHPGVVLSRKETGQIFNIFNRRNPLYLLNLVKFYRIFGIPLIRKIFDPKIDRIMYYYKLKNLDDQDHKYKSPNEIYKENEIINTTLCMKSLNDQVYLTKYFNKIFPEVYNIGLVRDGYALCNSYTRRGKSVSYFSKIYNKYMGKIIEDKKYLKNYFIIRFENIIKNPFDVSKDLYKYLGVNPDYINNIRLKSKRVIRKNGAHKAKYGEVNRQYWFDKNDVDSILNSNINRNQKLQLSDFQVKYLEKNSIHILKYFGYYEKQ